MKLPEVMDADDWRLIAQGFLLSAMFAVGILASAATVALAWVVFRTVGGL